ncbi:ubiquinol-cytochrome c reductase iron-sulfur subunit [Nitratifractor sp.]|uniref:ubiquinol-cytochrome c reductase iron-sulfur subunit n=1 Tax=Nitratifractor sp. TaxID=2268144 RepID=UPI0025F0F033|nr:ubiquinol-cytochrome c reductase iron-sulfur subunit [Nitratifractor sp.]
MSDRRDFFGKALGAFAGLGALGALYAAKRTWDPLPSVKAAGFTTIDLSNTQENVLYTEMWRGKPIFVIKVPKNAKPSEAPNGNMENAYDDKRLIKVGDSKFFIAIGLCTHLGCIPAYYPDKHKFICACHGGQFNAAGEVLKSPPPSPLVIPPFTVKGMKVVLGEAGPEYKKLKEAGLVA